jgi:hypothetical protein
MSNALRILVLHCLTKVIVPVGAESSCVFRCDSLPVSHGRLILVEEFESPGPVGERTQTPC